MAPWAVLTVGTLPMLGRSVRCVRGFGPVAGGGAHAVESPADDPARRDPDDVAAEPAVGGARAGQCCCGTADFDATGIRWPHREHCVDDERHLGVAKYVAPLLRRRQGVSDDVDAGPVGTEVDADGADLWVAVAADGAQSSDRLLAQVGQFGCGERRGACFQSSCCRRSVCKWVCSRVNTRSMQLSSSGSIWSKNSSRTDSLCSGTAMRSASAPVAVSTAR